MNVYIILYITQVSSVVLEVYSSFAVASERVIQLRENEERDSVYYGVVTVPLLSKLPY